MGCAYSQKNFNNIGQEIDRGQYGYAAWRATVGVFISGIVDVVSLGGALSPEEASETWSGAAQQATTQGAALGSTQPSSDYQYTGSNGDCQFTQATGLCDTGYDPHAPKNDTRSIQPYQAPSGPAQSNRGVQ